MLIIVLLIAAFNLASSAPLSPSTTDFDVTSSLTIFGRELPERVNVAHYRTMQDIIWSCFTTIFACSWIAVHPNVPKTEDSRTIKSSKRVLTMVYAILAPEFVITWALRQWKGARRNAAKYNEKYHGSLWTTTHGFLLEMHGLVDDSGKPAHSVDEIPFPLDISEEEIEDKSKGDFLTKLLVLLHTTWFIIQCLARWITHLPITELEVATLAFALLNIGAYALWWNKPQGMGLAIRMNRYGSPTKDLQEQKEVVGGDGGKAIQGIQGAPEEVGSEESTDEAFIQLESRPEQQAVLWRRATEVIRRLVCRLGVLLDKVTCFLRSLTFMNIIGGPFKPLLAMLDSNFSGECNHIFYSSWYDGSPWPPTMVIGTVFAGLHLIPLWSSSFPSSAEKLLWKISAIFITVQPLFVTVALHILGQMQETSIKLRFVFFVCVTFLLYLVARLILVVLVFTTLRNLPPDTFRNFAWTTFLPHVY